MMLKLSNHIIKRILDICRRLNINLAQVQLYELSHLSVFLGEQQDYTTLEVSYLLLRPIIDILTIDTVASQYALGHPRCPAFLARPSRL